MIRKLNISTLLLLFLTISFSEVNAQYNTIYWMNHLPQQIYENPGKIPQCKFFVDLPTFPNISFNVNHSGFNLNDAIKNHPTALDTFMIDLDGIESALKEKNSINFETDISIFNIGFSVANSMFFTFGINYNIYENFNYPKDLIELKNGNYRADGTPLSLDFSQNLNMHREIFLGMAMKFNNLNLGARIKYLSGYANVQTKNLIIDWKTETSPDSMYEWTFDSNIDVRASAPIAWEIEYDENGQISGVNYDQDYIDNPAGHLNDYLFPKNYGFAIDLGAEYTYLNKFLFSVSVIDFGFINWKSNSKILTQNASFKFSGVDIAEYLGGVGEPTEENADLGSRIVTDLLDTLKTVFNPTVENIGYKTGLNTKIYAGADYLVTDWFDLGLLYRAVYANKKLYSSYTVSANTNFFKGWSYTLSYSIMDGFSHNLGMGLAYKIGPFQTYFIMDNVALPAWVVNESNFTDKWLLNTKRFNLSFGMNFVICGKKTDDIGLLE